MFTRRVETLEFEEPDLLARVPGCCDPVAGMVMTGLKLKPPPNYQDVLVGPKRLLQFRDAKASQLRRLIIFSVFANPVSIRHAGGDALDPGQWLTRWNEDPTFQRLVRADDRFRTFRDALANNFREEHRCVLAVETSRQALSKLIAPNPAAQAAMHNYMENGGI